MAKKTKVVTSTVELTPDEVSEILTAHFKKKGFEVESTYYDVGDVYDGGYGDPPSTVLKSVRLTQIKTVEQEI
jgi:hypothetical protein